LLLFGLRGYFRGLFREVFSLLGLVVGFIGAARYDEQLSALAATYWNPGALVLKGTAFVASFFVIYLLFNLAGWLLHRSAKILFLQTVNRLGGIALGVGKGTAVTALVIFAMTSTTLVPHSTRVKLDNAYLVSPLARLADALIRFGKAAIFVEQSGQARAAARSRAG
jgi:membrane protein required for colicin V production